MLARLLPRIFAAMIIAAALAATAWAASSPPVTSTVTITTATTSASPVITGGTARLVTPVASGQVTLPSGMLTTNSSTSLSGCTIASGGTMSSSANGATLPGPFSIAASGANCVLSTTGLTGYGFAYLNITASNSSGTSLTTPIAVQWKQWSSNAPNVIPATITRLAPAGATFPTGTVMGRLGTDTCVTGVNASCQVASGTNAAPPPTSCAVSNVAFSSGSGSFTVAKSNNGYNCIVSVGSTALSANGTATMTVTATNANGTGAPAAVTVTWSTTPSGAPVVSQSSFGLTTPATAGTTVGTVSVSNFSGPPTGATCSLSGDPGNPVLYFTVTPVSGGCQIKTNPNGPTLSGSLGSPLLYVTATNASGTSIGNYVVVSMGPIQSSFPSYVPSAVSAAGYTKLIINDTSWSTALLDSTDSGLPLPTLHWYGNHGNFPGPYNVCDTGGTGLFSCDYADTPSMFDKSVQDQSGDHLASTVVSVAGSPGVLSLASAANGSALQMCSQFGFTPYNTQYPLIGHAFGGGFYMDLQSQFPASAITHSGNGPFSIASTLEMNGWVTPTSTIITEQDLTLPEFGSNLDFYTFNGAQGGAVFGSCSGGSAAGATNCYPTDGAMHHWGVLVEPIAVHGGGTGLIQFFLDGTSIGTNTYTAGQQASGFENQHTCMYLQPVPASIFTWKFGNYQVWQHP